MDSTIIDNTQGKTFLPAAKSNPSRFTASASGMPTYTGKISLRHDQIGELGLAYMGGVYNTWQDRRRHGRQQTCGQCYSISISILPLPKWGTNVVGEWAWVFVQLPPDYTPEYSGRQYGGFIDVVQPIFRGRILDLGSCDGEPGHTR